MLQSPVLMRKDVLTESSKHILRETPLLILQVVDIFQTQSYTTIVEHQDENIQLESHENNQIFYHILIFSNKMFMFFFLLRFINSTIIFEQVVEVLDNGSLCELALDIGGADINWSKCFKVFVIYSCSLVAHSNFKEGFSIVTIGKISFLFTYGWYLSNFVSIAVHAPFSAIDCSILIGLLITLLEGLPKAKIDVFNWFNRRSKIKVTLGDVMAFDWENILVASWKARSSSAKILRRSHSSDMIKEIQLPSLRQVIAIVFNTFLLSHAVVIMTYVEFHLVVTSMVNKFLFDILYLSHNSLYLWILCGALFAARTSFRSRRRIALNGLCDVTSTSSSSHSSSSSLSEHNKVNDKLPNFFEPPWTSRLRTWAIHGTLNCLVNVDPFSLNKFSKLATIVLLSLALSVVIAKN